MAICMSKCASNVANGTGVMSGVSWVPDGVSCDLFAPQEVESMVTLFSKLLFYNSVICWSSSLCFNPTRGGPAIVITCDSGKEGKIKREGLEMINCHYQQQQLAMTGDETSNPATDENAENDASKTKDGDDAANDKMLSLEDELVQLKAESNNSSKGSKERQRSHRLIHNEPFVVYDAGCRGMVFVVCALPDGALIPKTSLGAKDKDSNNKERTNEKDNNGDTNNVEEEEEEDGA